ncbi:MAG: hypothetical protein M1839_000202 [Geoglossum umbratile]|nr:MAG: hypothetical protein M1839_000202 [Geoglossum umbratile]
MLFSKLPIVALISVGFAGLSAASVPDASARDFAGFDFALEKRQNNGGNGKAANNDNNNNNNNQNDACKGQTPTNGKQIKGGSCNAVSELPKFFCPWFVTDGDVVMGFIPKNTQMTSTVIISPKPGEDLPADKSFTVSLKVKNLQAGQFSNADTQYYSQPQSLNGQGVILGHTHVTIQDMGGSLTPGAPLDATKFAFFKGINDAGDGNGGLTADVTGGLPAGFYRICTMASAFTHQPVIMPVAQRGTQDDCTKFTVGQGNQGGNNQGGKKGGNGKNKKKGKRHFQA